MGGRLITAKEVAEDLACSMQHAACLQDRQEAQREAGRDGLHNDAGKDQSKLLRKVMSEALVAAS
ncbi:hypothetical protein [Ellagibacter isourolithinifaciens]|uniref:hypothetical protein n=1 Tax=Ellagibacter isourolithinifaciens TaxID=2137581 RepID=UPI003A8CD5FB